MTGHSQNVADNLANADILAVVPHQLQGAGWRQGDIEHPAATDVRLAAGVGAAHHIGADETEDSTSTRSSQRGRRPAQSIESIPSRRGRPISTVRATKTYAYRPYAPSSMACSSAQRGVAQYAPHERSQTRHFTNGASGCQQGATRGQRRHVVAFNDWIHARRGLW